TISLELIRRRRPQHPGNASCVVESLMVCPVPGRLVFVRLFHTKRENLVIHGIRRTSPLALGLSVLLAGCSGAPSNQHAEHKQPAAKAAAPAQPAPKAAAPAAEAKPAAKAEVSAEAEAEIKANLAKLAPEDRKLAEAQRFCAIEEDSRLGAMGEPLKLMIQGKA